MNKLIIKAYTTNINNYDQLVWELNKDDEVAVGIWGDYFKTVVMGCCGAEDGYTLYDTETGKEFLKFSELKYSSSPYYMMYGYASINTMTFTNQGDKSIVGNFYHIKEDRKSNQGHCPIKCVNGASK